MCQLRNCGRPTGIGACCEYSVCIYEYGGGGTLGSGYGEGECNDGGYGARVEGAS